jgi:hypothetical protein
MSDLEDLFSQIEEEPIPGGCEQCDAYQALVTLAPGVYSMTVHHDDWCPALNAMNPGRN